MTRTDMLRVEYYDQLSVVERAEYRDKVSWRDFCDDVAAVTEEFDRIDSGLKAHCLS